MARKPLQQVPDPAPDEEALECLERLREAVESGELRELAAVGVNRGGEIVAEWNASSPPLVGAVAWLQKKLLAELDEADT